MSEQQKTTVRQALRESRQTLAEISDEDRTAFSLYHLADQIDRLERRIERIEEACAIPEETGG